MNIPDEPNPYANFKPPYKVILVGDTAVGKTTLIQRMHKNDFFENIESTIGAGSFTIPYNFGEQYLEFEVFDTAGQEQYKSITKFYLKNATVSLICFDPQKENWDESAREWQNLVIDEEPDTKFIGVATKYDLWCDTLQMKKIISDFHKRCNIDNIVCVSSLTGANIGNLLNIMAQICENDAINATFPKPEPKPDPHCSC